MAVEYVESVNKRPDSGSGSQRFSFYTTFKKTLADDEKAVFHLPKAARWSPGTLIVSSTTTVTVEATCSDYESIEAEVNGDDTGGEGEPTTPIWVAFAALSSKIVPLTTPFTAVKVINESGGPINVELIL